MAISAFHASLVIDLSPHGQKRTLGISVNYTTERKDGIEERLSK